MSIEETDPDITTIKETTQKETANSVEEIKEDLLPLVEANRNIFISGPPGTGKSYKLKELYGILSARGVMVSLTATTGTSAVNIGGTTIHSWSGIKLGDKDLMVHYDQILHSRAKKRWK